MSTLKGQGGPGRGQGRKKGAALDLVKQAINEAIKQSDKNVMTDIWKEVITRAKAGSDKHTMILFNYYYGKPKENLEEPKEVTVRIVHE